MTVELSFKTIVNAIEDRLKIHVLTHEYEIVACFFDHFELTAQQISHYCRSSSTTFYTSLKRLEARGVLESAPHPEDGRRRLYRLSRYSLDVIHEDKASVSTWFNPDTYLTAPENDLLKRFSANIKCKLHVRHLTCDYQILIYLFGKSGLSNIEFTDLVDVSITKSNASLKKLTEMGLIFSEQDSTDKRCKRYYLTEQTHRVIDEGQKLVSQWVALRTSAPDSGWGCDGPASVRAPAGAI